MSLRNNVLTQNLNADKNRRDSACVQEISRSSSLAIPTLIVAYVLAPSRPAYQSVWPPLVDEISICYLKYQLRSCTGPKINRSCRGVDRRGKGESEKERAKRGVDYKPKATEKVREWRAKCGGGFTRRGGGVCSNSNSNSSHGGPLWGWFTGSCTGHCCINRFGELGVATPEGTAHVRIDYTTPSPRITSLLLTLSFSHPLASRASSRFSATGGWLRFPLS